mgnify:CR=1 FL=1
MRKIARRWQGRKLVALMSLWSALPSHEQQSEISGHQDPYYRGAGVRMQNTRIVDQGRTCLPKHHQRQISFVNFFHN